MAVLGALALLAPLSVLASGLPPPLAWPGALLALACGALELRRLAARPRCVLSLPAGAGPAHCDGEPVRALRVAWRGPLVFLRWRTPAGRVRRLAFWPDTLDAAGRRELRLVLQRREAAAITASVAG